MAGDSITLRECDTKHKDLDTWVTKLETRIEIIEGELLKRWTKLEKMLWLIIILLVANLSNGQQFAENLIKKLIW